MHQSTATNYTQESGNSGGIDLLFSRALHGADAGIAAGTLKTILLRINLTL